MTLVQPIYFLIRPKKVKIIFLNETSDFGLGTAMSKGIGKSNDGERGRARLVSGKRKIIFFNNIYQITIRIFLNQDS
jgi:hypothetical protein